VSAITDLATILTGANVAVLGTSLFLGLTAVIPAGDGPFLSVVMTGGSGPEGTHNAVGLPAYQRPTAQIIARGASTPAAEALAIAAYTALWAVRNQFVNGVWWRQILPLQEPSEALGEDADGRAQWSFNVAIEKRPNAAMSL